jgi:hypothetical protein
MVNGAPHPLRFDFNWAQFDLDFINLPTIPPIAVYIMLRGAVTTSRSIYDCSDSSVMSIMLRRLWLATPAEEKPRLISDLRYHYTVCVHRGYARSVLGLLSLRELNFECHVNLFDLPDHEVSTVATLLANRYLVTVAVVFVPMLTDGSGLSVYMFNSILDYLRPIGSQLTLLQRLRLLENVVNFKKACDVQKQAPDVGAKRAAIVSSSNFLIRKGHAFCSFCKLYTAAKPCCNLCHVYVCRQCKRQTIGPHR